MSKLIHLCLHVHTHVHIFMLAWLGRSLQFFLNTVTALPWEAKISALEMCHSFLPNPPLWSFGLGNWKIIHMSRAGSFLGRLLEYFHQGAMIALLTAHLLLLHTASDVVLRLCPAPWHQEMGTVRDIVQTAQQYWTEFMFLLPHWTFNLVLSEAQERAVRSS